MTHPFLQSSSKATFMSLIYVLAANVVVAVGVTAN